MFRNAVLSPMPTLMIALALALGGCREGPEEPPSAAAPHEETAPQVDEGTRRFLRALGYLDYAPRAAAGGHGVVVHDSERAFPGYSLLSNRRLCLAELIDMTGDVVHAWSDEGPCRFWSTADLLPGGDLLVTGMDAVEGVGADAIETMYLLRLSWEGRVVFKARIGAHHDAELTTDDRILTPTLRARRVPELNPDTDVIDSFLTELSADGEILSEFSLLDAFRSSPRRLKLRATPARERWGRRVIDVLHINTVESMKRPGLVGQHPIYDLGNVLVCSRRQNTIGVIDPKTRTLIWAWGKGTLSAPHHPTVLANGNILIFDNGTWRKWSRVIELDPRTEEIAWTYVAPEPKAFFSRSRGSNQRLPNGNTLIAESDAGRAFEVTPEREIVWEYRNPHLDARGRRATIERITRYEPRMVERLLAE